MSTIAVTGDVVALCLTREELGERGFGRDITDKDAREIVREELVLAGRAPWPYMEVELFSSREDFLLVARPATIEPQSFAFSDFEGVLAAAGHIGAGLRSRLVYYEGAYVLLVRARYNELPCVLLEFGEHVGDSEHYASHVSEHGEVIIPRGAVDMLREKFCGG